MRTYLWTVFVLAVVASIVLPIIFYATMKYPRDADTEAYMERACLAGDLDEMQSYLVQAKDGMDKWGLNQGHGAVFFEKADNDFQLQYQVIENLIYRIEISKDIPKNTEGYQWAMMELREEIDALPSVAEGWAWAHYGFWLLIASSVLWFCVVVAIVIYVD